MKRRDFEEADLGKTVDVHDLSSSHLRLVPEARKEQCRSGIGNSIQLLSDPARHLHIGLASDQEDARLILAGNRKDTGESRVCEPSGSQEGRWAVDRPVEGTTCIIICVVLAS